MLILALKSYDFSSLISVRTVTYQAGRKTQQHLFEMVHFILYLQHFVAEFYA